MTPTIVLKNNKPLIVETSSTIITTTMQTILNVIDHKMNIKEAVLRASVSFTMATRCNSNRASRISRGCIN